MKDQKDQIIYIRTKPRGEVVFAQVWRTGYQVLVVKNSHIFNKIKEASVVSGLL